MADGLPETHQDREDGSKIPSDCPIGSETIVLILSNHVDRVVDLAFGVREVQVANVVLREWRERERGNVSWGTESYEMKSFFFSTNRRISNEFSLEALTIFGGRGTIG